MWTSEQWTRSLARPVVAAGVLAVLAAGCSSTGATPSSGGKNEPCPLNQYVGECTGGGGFGELSLGGPGVNAAKKQLYRKIENAMAACMRNQGFEYIPIVPPWNLMAKANLAHRLPTKESAELYGYGMARWT